MTCSCLIFMALGIFYLNTSSLLHRGFGPVIHICRVYKSFIFLSDLERFNIPFLWRFVIRCAYHCCRSFVAMLH
jgi:hypothetical protein